MSQRNDKMVVAGGDPIQGNNGAFTARLSDGSVACWGHKDFGAGSSVTHAKAICATFGLVEFCGGAFAAIAEDDTVTCWGHPVLGGDCSAVATELKDVQGICGTMMGFAALKRDGTVTTWGNAVLGENSSVYSQLTGVKAIYSTFLAFAAVLHDGSVEAWGSEESGGLIPPSVKERLKQVQCISGTSYAFAALLSDGTVETWGDQDCGGDSSELAGQLTDVVSICAACFVFAALKKDGTVVCWGREEYGGLVSPQVKRRLERVVAVSSSGAAFAALRSDGSVVTWGHRDFGANSASVAGELKEVVAIRGAEYAFAALRKDGTVVTWGSEDSGGDSSAVQSELTQVVAISSTGRAFAARRSDGTVVTWGNKDFGGDSSSVPALRQAGAIGKAPLCDGSVEFWSQRLVGVLEAEDIASSALKFSVAGFKQRHVGEISRDDLKMAGLNQGVIMDFLRNQHLILRSKGNGSGKVLPPPAIPVQAAILPRLPRIPEEDITLDAEQGEGAFSVVWRATWRRKIAVGKPGVNLTQVAVKIPHRNNNSNLIELARDLAVISGLPHQNIVIVHGISETQANNGAPVMRIVYELMTMDLAKLLKETQRQKHKSSESPSSSASPSRPLLPAQLLLRVLRDVSAGLAHLHLNGVLHRDVKPANVLLRDEQVKLCDFGSSKDLQHSLQQMSVAGTVDYMSPEVWNQQPVGRPADVWSFGVLLFECVTGAPCRRAHSMTELVAELSQAKCLPALVKLFEECHQAEPTKRPSMANIHLRLQSLVMQEARDSQRLKDELKRAEAQDKETYESTWNSCRANQPHLPKLLEFLKKEKQQQSQEHVRQPLKQSAGKGSLKELEELASGTLCRLHAHLKAIVEECGGTYSWAPRKSSKRCAEKVEQDYDGDYSKLLDLERATGLFGQAEDILRCLKKLQEEVHHDSASVVVHVLHPSSSSSSSSSSPLSLRVLRCKDRMNKPLPSGYRDILLNVCEAESGFVAELQLNFHNIAQIKSQSHRFYELLRVMEIQLAP